MPKARPASADLLLTGCDAVGHLAAGPGRHSRTSPPSRRPLSPRRTGSSTVRHHPPGVNPPRPGREPGGHNNPRLEPGTPPSPSSGCVTRGRSPTPLGDLTQDQAAGEIQALVDQKVSSQSGAGAAGHRLGDPGSPAAELIDAEHDANLLVMAHGQRRPRPAGGGLGEQPSGLRRSLPRRHHLPADSGRSGRHAGRRAFPRAGAPE